MSTTQRRKKKRRTSGVDAETSLAIVAPPLAAPRQAENKIVGMEAITNGNVENADDKDAAASDGGMMSFFGTLAM